MAIRREKRSRYTHGGPGMYMNIFFLDSDSDIENLPTSKEGKGELEPTAADSMAVVIGDGGGTKILLLNGNDEWVEV